MATEDEAKQLDSVTDRVQEKELDESRATQALAGALSAASSVGKGGVTSFIPKKEDVNYIVEELEVTEDEAVAALRSVAAERGEEGKQLVASALRRLVR
jgi:hypothetical protein